jgi:hypothetical protein
VSSPNEPGYPRAGDGSGNGSASGSQGPSHEGGSIGAAADIPPWQRGPAARAARQPQRQPQEPAPRPEATRGESPSGRPAGVDARLNRFIAGGSAPAQEAEASPRDRTEVVRTEAVRPEAYASELPDLSGPMPRGAQQRKPPTPEPRPQAEPVSRSTAASRVQVGSRNKGPVRASMQIRRIDPWSTLKVSLVLSVALFFVWMIAVAFLYLVLGGMGVWSKLNSNVGDLLTSSGGSGGELVSSGTIFGGATLIGLVNIVLLTAMATCGAFIYNLTTDLVGGVEVTLADRD